MIRPPRDEKRAYRPLCSKIKGEQHVPFSAPSYTVQYIVLRLSSNVCSSE